MDRVDQTVGKDDLSIHMLSRGDSGSLDAGPSWESGQIIITKKAKVFTVAFAVAMVIFWMGAIVKIPFLAVGIALVGGSSLTWYLFNRCPDIYWDSKGITQDYGKGRRVRHLWSDGIYVKRSGVIFSSKNPKKGICGVAASANNSGRALLAATLDKMPTDSPKVIEYAAPPLKRAQRHTLFVGMVLSMTFSYTSMAQFFRVMATTVKSGVWPPDLTLFVGFFIGLLGVLLLGLRLSQDSTTRREPSLWQPTASMKLVKLLLPLGNPPSSSLTTVLQPRQLYIYNRSSIGAKGPAKSAILFAIVFGALAVYVASRHMNVLIFIMSAGVSIICLVAALLLRLASVDLRQMPEVDEDAVVECTESGIRLWKGGLPTPILHYPHSLTGKWCKSAFGGSVEVWSDAYEQHAIDRRFLVPIPEDAPPCVRYAATEGGGWLHPESKAIADQMLAERDWSKPLPKKGQ